MVLDGGGRTLHCEGVRAAASSLSRGDAHYSFCTPRTCDYAVLLLLLLVCAASLFSHDSLFRHGIVRHTLVRPHL